LKINKNVLGNSGMKITRVGIGTWAIGYLKGGFNWGPQDEPAAVAAICHGVDIGINWVDTAAEYGAGQSERLLGRALKQIPAHKRPFVFTKCGQIRTEANLIGPPKRTLRPDTIRMEIEASLTRLGLERIDLYQFHWPPLVDSVPIEESWGEMARLVEEGKVGAIGVSNFDIELLERCEAVHHIDSLQPPFSMIRRDSAEKLIPWCKAHNVGVIVYSPMQSGLLTDGFSLERLQKMDSEDWRPRRNPDFQSPKLERNLALKDALRPIADRHHTSISSIAISWVLSWPGMTGAIVGARAPAQVDGWSDALTLELDRTDLDEIAEAIKRTGAGTGPIRPPV
jgi:aryl-alcohol dehydrogenase-like predicted oxidoreductase